MKTDKERMNKAIEMQKIIEIIGDDYPTYEQYVQEAQKSGITQSLYSKDHNIPPLKANTFHANILSIAKNMRQGDRVTIEADKYQVHMHHCGTSNFPITNDMRQD